MKSAVLSLLLVPASALAGVVAQVSVPGSGFVAPVLVAAPSLSAAPALRTFSPLELTPNALAAAPSLSPLAAPLALTPAAVPVAAAVAVPVAAPVAAPAALKAVPVALAAARGEAAAPAALSSARALAAAIPEGPDAGRFFDGASQAGPRVVDANFGPYRRLYGSEQAKLEATLRYGASGSQVFAALNDEFSRQGGYYVLDSDQNARYMAAAAVDQNRRPVIILTHDLLNRYNGRSEDVYRGAPWEFIASVIAREQVFYNAWYSVIPASAEKLAISYMNMTRVFVDLTNGTSRSWATDKDFQATAGDRTTYTQWNWFEQLVAAARAASEGAGTNSGHLIESKFFSWVRDWTAGQEKASVPSFQYSLWEMYDGKYYRPGDPKNGLPLPAGAPRIDKATYDRAAGTAYGVDGKGRAENGQLDGQTAYGWIIQWLKSRFEF